jgi:hypothetical protein
MRKNIIITLILLAVTTFSSSAMDNYPFSAGLTISGKMGVNAAEVPSGINNALAILSGVDVALVGYLPMSEDSKTGLFVELGYTNTPFSLKYYGSDISGDVNQKFITISPVVLISGFTAGLDFGFNLDTKMDKNILHLAPLDDDININVRLGGMVPLYTHSLGILNLVANAAYSITGSTYMGGNYTYHPTTLSIGLNYLFNLESDY